MSADQNAWVLGGHIRFSSLLNKWACYFPFTQLQVPLLLMLCLLFPPPSIWIGTSSIGLELTWSESFFFFLCFFFPGTSSSCLSLLTHCARQHSQHNVFQWQGPSMSCSQSLWLVNIVTPSFSSFLLSVSFVYPSDLRRQFFFLFSSSTKHETWRSNTISHSWWPPSSLWLLPTCYLLL